MIERSSFQQEGTAVRLVYVEQKNKLMRGIIIFIQSYQTSDFVHQPAQSLEHATKKLNVFDFQKVAHPNSARSILQCNMHFAIKLSPFQNKYSISICILQSSLADKSSKMLPFYF